MRSGKILAEDDPNVLLKRYETTHLEEVFLKLCHLKTNDNDSNQLNGISRGIGGQRLSFCENIIIDDFIEEDIGLSSIYLNKTNQALFIKNNCLTNKSEELKNNSIHCISLTKRDVDRQRLSSNFTFVSIRNSRFVDKSSALFHKNIKRITRKKSHLLFEIILPTLLLLVVYISVGDGPKGLNLAICDEELNNNITDGLGQLFVKCISNERFNLINYNSVEEALDSVKSGESWAAVIINERFTGALISRVRYMSETDHKSFEESLIRVHIDRSNQVNGILIEDHLLQASIDFIGVVLNRTNTNPDLLKIPLMFEEPVYGNRIHSFREFLLPGFYIVTIFYTTAYITANMFLEERREGLLERNFVAGITTLEILLSTLLTQFFILCFQILFILLLIYIIFNGQTTGSLTLFIALILSQGFCGVLMGLVISIVISDAIIGTLVLNWTYLSSMVTCGAIWPISNMPPVMQFIF